MFLDNCYTGTRYVSFRFEGCVFHIFFYQDKIALTVQKRWSLEKFR